jgi:hypothetical protein
LVSGDDIWAKYGVDQLETSKLPLRFQILGDQLRQKKTNHLENGIPGLFVGFHATHGDGSVPIRPAAGKRKYLGAAVRLTRLHASNLLAPLETQEDAPWQLAASISQRWGESVKGRTGLLGRGD